MSAEAGIPTGAENLAGTGRVLPPARFRRAVEREREVARLSRRGLALCVLGAPRQGGGAGRRELRRLGLVIALELPAGHVGWLADDRLGVVVRGSRRAAERLLARLELRNAQLGGGGLEAGIRLEPRVPAHEAHGPGDPDASGSAASGWSMPLSW
jgi:hypothetical protein